MTENVFGVAAFGRIPLPTCLHTHLPVTTRIPATARFRPRILQSQVRPRWQCRYSEQSDTTSCITSVPLPNRAIPVDYATLSHCVAALGLVAVPARVENVFQVDPSTLVVVLRTLSASLHLTLSFSQTHGRLSVDTAPRRASRSGGEAVGEAKQRRGKDVPYTLAATAKSLLQGTALVAASIAAPFERIARLEFAPSLSEPICGIIFLELLGNGRSNLALTDGSLTVKACGRQVAARTAARALQTGLSWQPPPPPRGIHPTDNSVGDTLLNLAGNDDSALLGKTLVRVVAGVSPAVAGLVCRHAGKSVSSVCAEATLSDLQRFGGNWATAVAASLKIWFLAHDRVEQVRVVGRTNNGLLNGYELEFVAIGPGDSQDDVSEHALATGRVLEQYYGGLEISQKITARCARLRKVVLGRLARARSNDNEFTQKIEECGTIEKLKRDAMFLYSYSHSWSPGDDVVRGEWVLSAASESDGEAATVLQMHEVRLPQDIGTDPVVFAKRLYRQAGKLERARDIAETRLAEAKAEIDCLESALLHIDMCRTLDDVDVVEGEVSEILALVLHGAGQTREGRPTGMKEAKRLQGKSSARKKGRQTGMSKASSQTDGLSGVLRIEIASEGGDVEIFVGRNAKGNETVTFSLARKNDIWLHAAGLPGSHVLVREACGSPVNVKDGDILQTAANFAAFFSKARESTNVPVSVMRAGDVRRAPGTPRRPGAVTMVGNELKTLYGRPVVVQNEALSALGKQRTQS